MSFNSVVFAGYKVQISRQNFDRTSCSFCFILKLFQFTSKFLPLFLIDILDFVSFVHYTVWLLRDNKVYRKFNTLRCGYNRTTIGSFDQTELVRLAGCSQRQTPVFDCQLGYQGEVSISDCYFFQGYPHIKPEEFSILYRNFCLFRY